MSTRKPSNSETNWSMGAALGAATLASACCTIPLALVSLGIGGAWLGTLTALEPYRWLFVSLAVGTLSYAGYNEWQLSRRSDCDCDTSLSPTTRRSLLGVGVLAVVGLIVSPWLLVPSPSAATQKVRAATAQTDQPASPASFQQVVLKVEGMTCATCPITVRKALERVEGVFSAKATYEPPEAVVRFDPEKTSTRVLTEATKNVGFPSKPKPAP